MTTPTHGAVKVDDEAKEMRLYVENRLVSVYPFTEANRQEVADAVAKEAARVMGLL